MSDDPLCWGDAICNAASVLLPLAVACYRVGSRVIGEAIAIGDTDNPVLSPGHSIALLAAYWPAMALHYMALWYPVGEWLKPLLGDSGTIDLFLAADAVFWAAALQKVIGRHASRVAAVAAGVAECVGLWRLRFWVDAP
jgi:hypothetical protein